MRIVDGAIGTELARQGFALAAPSFAVAANESAPELVRTLHEQYLQAGAQELTLNSFGLSGGLALDQGPLLLARARAAVDRVPRSAGSIPLCGALSLSPEPKSATRLLAEARALLEAGVKKLRLETLVDPEPLGSIRVELVQALRAHQARLCLSLCPAQEPMQALLERIETQGWLAAPELVAMGINCVNLASTQRESLVLANWLRGRTLGLELRPHLSRSDAQGQWHTHACSPAKLVEWYRGLFAQLFAQGPLSAGQDLAIGCCCGGGPEHIAALHQSRDALLISSRV